MKRGLITWDKAELPPEVFDVRLAKLRHAMGDLPACVVYADVARSNEGRHFTNFMPYWNRSLIIVPKADAPVLLCGLSPRVYPWIRSVTVFEEIKPAAKLVPTLVQFCGERGWGRVGVLNLPQLIHEVFAPLSASGIELVDVPMSLEPDSAEVQMMATAKALAEQVIQGCSLVGLTRQQVAGTLERALRRAGFEDVVLRMRERVTVDVEYRGHWVRVEANA